MYKSAKVVILGAILAIFSGCGGGGGGSSKSELSNTTQTQETTNLPPTVYVGEDRRVEVNKPVTIIAKASDPDGIITQIEWKRGDEVLGTTLTLVYTPTEVGKETLTLVVVDNDGASASDSIILEVVEEKDIEPEEPLPFY